MKMKLMLLLMSVLVLLNSIPTYADSVLVQNGTTYSYEGVPDFPTGYKTYVLCYSGGIYSLICSNEELKLYNVPDNSTGTGVINSDDGSSSFLYDYYVCSGSSIWNLGYANENWSSNSLVHYVVCANVNTYTDSSCTEILFPHLAPPSSRIANLTAAEMSQMTMKQTLSLVPLVMGLIVCCLALRKASAMLWRALKTA